ncbi:S8 family serine peptidase, partial [Candidatus Aenigmatarchaeota archaeon]
MITISIAFSIGITEIADAAPMDFNPENFERFIIERIGDNDIESFKNMGCMLKHVIGDSASFDCPENIKSTLSGTNARKARIFRVVDLAADQQTGADLVWAEGITGNGVSVAILDTGIDTDHPELMDSYLGGYDFVNNDAIPEDDHGHGTHVAGIITSNGAVNSNSKGSAPGAGIYMYKVCDSGGACYEDDMMAAMEAAVQAGANVMSISIGGGVYTSENCDSDPLAAKVNWAVDQGLTAVIAAGNNGKGVSSPGCASGAIAVGAVDSNNNIPYWSGRGDALDIVAPGVSIYSTYLNGGYGYMSGTSMATPHVAGVVSLLLETDSTLTTSEIKTALYDTANPADTCFSCKIYSWWGTCYGYREISCTPYVMGAGVVVSQGRIPPRWTGQLPT